jgi:hypothetical protein
VGFGPVGVVFGTGCAVGVLGVAASGVVGGLSLVTSLGVVSSASPFELDEHAASGSISEPKLNTALHA